MLGWWYRGTRFYQTCERHHQNLRRRFSFPPPNMCPRVKIKGGSKELPLLSLMPLTPQLSLRRFLRASRSWREITTKEGRPAAGNIMDPVCVPFGPQTGEKSGSTCWSRGSGRAPGSDVSYVSVRGVNLSRGSAVLSLFVSRRALFAAHKGRGAENGGPRGRGGRGPCRTAEKWTPRVITTS